MGEISDQAEGVADPDDAIDPYTIQTDGVREAPSTLIGRFKSLGPGIVVSGSIVCILFSTVLSGIGAGSRSFPDLLVTLGFIDRQNLERRKKWIRGYIIAMPIISTVIYLFYQEPIALVIFGATFGAFMLPVQSFMTIYVQRKRMDPRVWPGPWIRGAVVVVFLIQAILSAFIIWNIFFGF